MTDSVPAQKFERKEVKVGMSDVIKDGVDGKSKVRGAEKKINKNRWSNLV